MLRRFPATTLPLAAALLALGSRGPAHVTPNVWELIGLWLIAAEVHVTLHELGHVIAGTLAGFRVYALDTGLLHLRLRPTFRLALQLRIPLWLSGFTRTAPVRVMSRAEQVVLVLGGPLMSLSTGLAAILFALNHLPPAGIGTGTWWLISYGIVALASACFALAPRRTAGIGVLSDGALLLSILRGESRGTAPWVSRLRVQTSLQLRPRETDVSLDEALASAMARGASDGGEELVLASVLALDGPTPQRARSPVELALDQLGQVSAGNVRDVLHLNALYFALVEPDAERALAALRRLREHEGAQDGSAELAEAAFASMSTPAEAVDHLERWVQWTEKAEIPGFRRAGNEWAVELIAKRVALGPQQVVDRR